MSIKNFDLKVRILLSVFLFFGLASFVAALVSINPASANVTSCSQNYLLNISLSSVANLYGFQFDMTYNSSVLDVLSVSEGSFLKSQGSTFWIAPDISTPGLIKNAVCSLVQNVGTNGNSGILANVTFRIKNQSSYPQISILSLTNVKLSDINSNP